MGDKTGIAWCDASWNPLRGCSRVSAGCEHCYAEKVAHRFSGPGQPYEGLTREGRWNGTIKLVPKHLRDPLHWRRPRRVFVNSMSDLFHEGVPLDYLDRVFAVMALAARGRLRKRDAWRKDAAERQGPGHTFQVLTKRPERMREYIRDPDAPARIWLQARRLDPWGDGRTVYGGHLQPRSGEQNTLPEWPLPNVHLLASVEDQKAADERIAILLDTPAAVRGISAEPLLGPLDFFWTRDAHGLGESGGWVDPLRGWSHDGHGDSCGVNRLNWVIVGGESGPGARPCHVEWIRSIVQQCQEAEVPCFVKQMGRGASMHTDAGRGFHVRDGDGYIVLKCPKGDDPAEWPEDLRVQEFPA